MSHETKKEIAVLESWKLKLAVLSAIIFPTITATGAFYGLKSEMKDQQAAINEKVAALELKTQKEFIDKETGKELRDEVRALRSSMDEIKNILLKKR
jgi:uncharacterized protein YfiM (DUF2279 family)